MNNAVPDCLVTGYEPLVDAIDLPDEGDRHVVAAAIMTRANVIVTFNLQDFPESLLLPFQLHAKHPDKFLLGTFSIAPQIFLEAVRNDFQHYRTPSLEYKEYIESLAKAGVPEAANLLEQFAVLMTDES